MKTIILTLFVVLTTAIEATTAGAVGTYHPPAQDSYQNNGMGGD